MRAYHLKNILRFGKELNSDIFHQSIKNAIGVYKKHPEFDLDNRVESKPKSIINIPVFYH
jgi:hypothetical protein